MKWDKLKQAIKDSKDNPDFDIWDFLADELGLDPNGKSDSDDEEEEECSDEKRCEDCTYCARTRVCDNCKCVGGCHLWCEYPEEYLAEEVEWSADRFGGDKCGFCNEPNDGLWIEGQEDAVCEKCSQVWEYDADTDSYHKIKKDQTN